MDLSADLEEEGISPASEGTTNDGAMDVVTADSTTTMGEVNVISTAVDDDSDECDDEISWIETVPLATISKGELYRNTRAIRWKGIDWMVVVMKARKQEQDAKFDRVGYFLGYEVAQIPKNFSVPVHLRCLGSIEFICGNGTCGYQSKCSFTIYCDSRVSTTKKSWIGV